MNSQIIFYIKKILIKLIFFINEPIKLIKIQYYLIQKKPFSKGYDTYKWFRIKKKIENKSTDIEEKKANGLDERIIEYKWIINELGAKQGTLLDAGSTLNFNLILKKLKSLKIYIQTLYPEKNNYNTLGVNYIYEDLSKRLFNNNFFDYITCISTLEHVGFNNRHYNYHQDDLKLDNKIDSKIHLKVIDNFKNYLKNDGILYLTLPYGKAQIFDHLQQFDSDGIKNIIDVFSPKKLEKRFFIYKNYSWLECEDYECKNILFRLQDEKNPKDNAASARSIILLKLIK